MITSCFVLLALSGSGLAATLKGKSNSGPTIDFSNNTGSTKHLASGILYGLPDNQTQIPSALLSGFGFNYGRAAGAQVGNGWCYSPAEYEGRFASALSNYRVTRAHGGGFVLMLHDLWGFDGLQNSTALGPGDHGNWTNYYAFLNAVISDIKKNKMQPGLVIDMWNEPELVFWGRSVKQWVEMYGRGFHRLRQAFPAGTVRLSGPTTSGPPTLDSDWWNQWAAFISKNGSAPDQYAWHEERGGSDNLDDSMVGLASVLSRYNLPSRTVNINEYGTFDEQVPAGSAFWISQLERSNAIGIRGNWLGGTQLHDLAASLLSKPDPNNYASTGYFPNGDWQVYNYYAKKMTGHRVSTSPSADGIMDAYATVGGGYAKILMGVRPPTTGTYDVIITGLSALGLPSQGTVAVRTREFAVGSDEHYSKVTGSKDLGLINHDYSGDTLNLPYFQTDNTTAFAWEFKVPN